MELGPMFLFNAQETPCPERHEHKGRSKVVYDLTGKMFLQEYDAKQYPPPLQELSTNHHSFPCG
jgi:hypothetical protein